MQHDPQRSAVRYGRRLAGAREKPHCTRAAARLDGASSLRKGHATPVYSGFGDGCGETRSSRTPMATRADRRAGRVRFDLEEPFLRDGSVRELKFDCEDP